VTDYVIAANTQQRTNLAGYIASQMSQLCDELESSLSLKYAHYTHANQVRTMSSKKKLLLITIPIITPMLNELMRMHYHTKRIKCSRVSALIQANCVIPNEPIKTCTIHVDRHSSGRLADWENLYASFKFIGDSLVVKSKQNPHGLGIIVDDSPLHIISLEMRQVKCKRVDQRMVIKIRY